MLFLADSHGHLPTVREDGNGDLFVVKYPCGCQAEIEGKSGLEGKPGEVVWSLACDTHVETVEPVPALTGTE